MAKISAKQIKDILPFPENYGPYAEIASGSPMHINLVDITKNNWQEHYDSILNILKDGIETAYVQSYKISVTFADGMTIGLCIIDYWINLIMWYLLIRTDTPVESKHIFFYDEIKKDTLKNYIDTFLINVNRKNYSNRELNNIIDDAQHNFHDIDLFAMYLSNTVNLEDNIALMQGDKEFYDCTHVDLSGIPIDTTSKVGMDIAYKSIDIIKNRSKDILGYDHCLADAWRASEGINPKQYKEVTVNIGPKPDGQGGAFPSIINSSFINGGVSDPLSYVIDSSGGRSAQIIKFNNVGISGHLARILGLNNMDSFLYPDPNYDCHSKNYVRVFIKNKNILHKLNNRYYRLHPNGMEYMIRDKKDKHLVGQTIYLRSPITCASAARGHGICYKCYGDLAYTVFDVNERFGVNIGRIASELVSSRLTQKLLSAKHLLEAAIKKLNWVKGFFEFFAIDSNVITISEDIEESLKNYKLIIDPEEIELENEEDDDLILTDDEDGFAGIPMFNEYITRFEVYNVATKAYTEISNDLKQKLYITSELNKAIRSGGHPLDGKVSIDFTTLKESPIFVVPLDNNELSKTLNHFEDLLNKQSVIKGMDYNTLLQELLETLIEGDMKVSSVHLEVIVSNQIRSVDNILERPNWDYPNEEYQILTLNTALNTNPSVLVSISYQKIAKMLYNPLTFKKRGASFMDLFFMERPQLAIYNIDTPPVKTHEPGELYEPVIFHDDPNKITVAPVEEIDDEFEPTVMRRKEKK